jgi:hypothetical protein
MSTDEHQRYEGDIEGRPGWTWVATFEHHDQREESWDYRMTMHRHGERKAEGLVRILPPGSPYALVQLPPKEHVLRMLHKRAKSRFVDWVLGGSE